MGTPTDAGSFEGKTSWSMGASGHTVENREDNGHIADTNGTGKQPCRNGDADDVHHNLPPTRVRSDRSRGGAMMPAMPDARGAEQHMQAVRQELHESLDVALQKRKELIQTLDQLTHKQGQQGTAVAAEGVPVGLGSSYDQPMSRAAVENLDQIDWMVARMMYCLDPKYNAVLDPAIAFEIQQKKAEDGQAIQKELSSEAIVAWERKMRRGAHVAGAGKGRGLCSWRWSSRFALQ